MSFINAGANLITKRDIIKDNELDNVYYNITILNSSSVIMPAIYADTKSETIIEDPWNYYLEVERFSLPGQALPIIQNWKDNYYYVTLTDIFGNNYSQPVQFIPQHIVSPAYLYGSIYSYEHLTQMINVAFAAAFALIPSLNLPGGLTQPPYILYSGPTVGFTLYCQTAYNPAVSSPTVQIWMNNVLYYLFDSWNMFFSGEQNVNHKDYMFIISNLYEEHSVITTGSTETVQTIIGPPSTYVTTPTTPTMLQFTQEYPTFYNIQSLKSIVFKSPASPIRSEFIPGITAMGVTSNTSALNWDNILTDFQPDATDPQGFRSYLQFSSPSFGYRLIDLLHSQPIRNISLNIFWRDQE